MNIGDKVYVPHDGAFPMKGLNTLAPSSQLDPSYFLVAKNVVGHKGIFEKRPGYAKLGSADLPLDSDVMAIIAYEPTPGTEKLVVLTQTKQYVYDSAGDGWDNITYQVAAADVDWTGDADDTVHATIATGTQGTWLIITNGKDKPRYWDGSGLFKLLEGAAGWSYTNFVTCKDLVMFYNHLVAVNITKTSANPNLIAWTANNSLVDFAATGSGEILTTDLRGEIIACVPLGDRLVIYGKDAIGVLTWVGGDQIFTYETLVQDTRLVSGKGMVNLGPYHLLLRKENVAGFDGTRAVRDVGDNISREYKEILAQDLKDQAWAFLDRPTNHIYFSVPTSATTQRIYLGEYDTFNILALNWSTIEFADFITAVGWMTRSSTLLWNSTSLTNWNVTGGRWSDGIGKKGFPLMVLGDSAGNVYQINGTSLTDDTVAIEAELQTVDFTASPGLSLVVRWLEIELDLRGQSVEILYSTDLGSSWTSLGEQTLGSDWARLRLDLDHLSRTVRFKLVSDSSGGFSVRWFRVWGLVAGERT